MRLIKLNIYVEATAIVFLVPDREYIYTSCGLSFNVCQCIKKKCNIPTKAASLLLFIAYIFLQGFLCLTVHVAYTDCTNTSNLKGYTSCMCFFIIITVFVFTAGGHHWSLCNCPDFRGVFNSEVVFLRNWKCPCLRCVHISGVSTVTGSTVCIMCMYMYYKVC